MGQVQMTLSDIECVCKTFPELEELACTVAVVTGDVVSPSFCRLLAWMKRCAMIEMITLFNRTLSFTLFYLPKTCTR